MVRLDRAMTTSYRQSSVNSNYVSICSGLGAIFNARFLTCYSRRILDMVRESQGCY